MLYKYSPGGRWVASGGDNKVCSCCESSCSEQRRKRDLGEDAGMLTETQHGEIPLSTFD